MEQVVMWKTLIAGAASLVLSAGAVAQVVSPPAQAPGPDGLPPTLAQVPAVNPPEFVQTVAPASDRVWGSAEFLLGNTTGVNVRPLIATGPLDPFRSRNGLGFSGKPGQPGTVPLFGGQQMLDDWRSGLRAEVGIWLDPARTWSASARFYSLFSTSEQFNAIGDATSVVRLSRPSFPRSGSVGDLFTPEALDYVSFPEFSTGSGTGFFTGSVSATVQTTFAGGDLNLRRVLFAGDRLQFQGFVGYRQMHLGDEVEVAFNIIPPPPGEFPLPVFAAQKGADSVRTRNNFYGPHIGTIGALDAGRWKLEGWASVSLGVNASDLDYHLAPQGIEQVHHPAVTTSGQADYFSVVAEGGVRAGFRVTDRVLLTVGYTGIYWSNVRRAQEQYSLETKPTGATTYLYASMLSFGAEVRY
jgi:hypothetical protein